MIDQLHSHTLAELKRLAEEPHHDVEDKQLDTARHLVKAMVYNGFIGRSYSNNKFRVQAIRDCKPFQRKTRQAAKGIAAQALRAVIDIPDAGPGTTVVEYAELEGQIARPADECFLFRYSHTSIPTSAKDFVCSKFECPAHDEVPLYIYRELPYTEGQQRQLGSFVLDSEGIELVPWAVVDHSSAVPGRDGSSSFGVFAWRRFNRDQILGVYVGQVMNRADVLREHIKQQNSQGEYDAMLVVDGYVISGKHDPYGQHSSNIVTVVGNDSGSSRPLYDKRYVGWPGMFCHLCNDARNTDYTNNARVTEPDTVMITSKRLQSIYNPYTATADNGRAEVLWSYGSSYHNKPQVTNQPAKQQQKHRVKKRQQQVEKQQPPNKRRGM